jgi:hypothetical protein
MLTDWLNEERLDCGRALFLRERERERDKEGENACKGAYTLFTGQREREREREYLFLKGMTGALAPFSYLVNK